MAGSMLAVDRLIAAPSSAAWNVLVDLDAWPQWGPTVSGARLDSPHTELSLGATGVVRTSLGFGVPFVVILIARGPWPAANSHVTTSPESALAASLPEPSGFRPVL